VGGLWSAWLFWFFEELASCVGKKPNVPNTLIKNFLVRWFFYFFLCLAIVWSGVEILVRVVVLPLPLTVCGFAFGRDF